LHFLAKNSTVVQCDANGKAADAPTRATNFVQVVRSPTNPIQTGNGQHNNDHSEADEMGASVAPGKKHHSGVRVDGANVLINSGKQLEQMC